MLHLFLDSKPWFRPKRYGYGAGPPVAWQGRVLLVTYSAAVIGLALLATRSGAAIQAGLAGAIVAFTAIFIVIARARTDGEWRWRWGETPG